jgi:arginine:ornithine antiporter/lysine permease
VSLWCSTCLVQTFLIIIYFQNSTYLALVNIATSAALVPYVFSGAYGLKLALKGETYAGQPHQRKRDLLLALVATVYGCWLVYAAGVEYLCWWRCSTARASSSTGRRASTTACAASTGWSRG